MKLLTSLLLTMLTTSVFALSIPVELNHEILIKEDDKSVLVSGKISKDVYQDGNILYPRGAVVTGIASYPNKETKQIALNFDKMYVGINKQSIKFKASVGNQNLPKRSKIVLRP